MEYQEFKQKLKDFAVFSLADIRKVEPRFYRRRLNEWQAKGYIKKLRRGHYLFADAPLGEGMLFLVANKLYAPSYVSFEAALSYYGLIPEGVYAITSASSKKTAKFKTPLGEFFYRSLKPQLMFGYGLQSAGAGGAATARQYKLADMEKAVLDYLYLNPTSTRKADLQEWRFAGKDFLARVDLKKFDRYVAAFHSPALKKRAKEFLEFIKYE